MSIWPQQFERSAVLGAIEEASGVPLSADDPLPDSLIARAQALGLDPVALRIWIYDEPRHDWSQDALARWAFARGFLNEELTC
jgi:hypothetical protein